MMELFEKAVDYIIDLVSGAGYWGIAAGMAVESANVPLPSEIILPLGGYLASMGLLNFYGAALAGTVGGTLGSLLSYCFGLWGGRPFLVKYGRYFGFSSRHLATAERWFERYGDAAVFFARLLPVIRTFISLPAGIAGMNVTKFLIFTFLGSLPWSLMLTYAGYALGQNWQAIEPWFHKINALLLLAFVSALVWYRLKRRNTPRKS